MNVIEIKQLHKSYQQLKAVDDISFEVKSGEIFGIIGPNGAGKTTTIECIIGLRKQDSGTINVLGFNPQLNHPKLKQKIGAQLQEAMLPANLKVGEALELFAALYHVSIDPEQILERFQFREKKNYYFAKLSGGQKQRLFVILATIHNPEILFFDEITTGLDPLSRQTTWELIGEIRKAGKTIILSTHLMEEAEQLCDRVAIINKGRLVALDTPDKLIARINIESKIQFIAEGNNDLQRLTTLTKVKDMQIKDNNLVTIYGDGTGFFEEVTHFLVVNNIKFRELQYKKPTLEDVFLTLFDSEQIERMKR